MSSPEQKRGLVKKQNKLKYQKDTTRSLLC